MFLKYKKLGFTIPIVVTLLGIGGIAITRMINLDSHGAGGSIQNDLTSTDVKLADDLVKRYVLKIGHSPCQDSKAFTDCKNGVFPITAIGEALSIDSESRIKLSKLNYYEGYYFHSFNDIDIKLANAAHRAIPSEGYKNSSGAFCRVALAIDSGKADQNYKKHTALGYIPKTVNFGFPVPKSMSGNELYYIDNTKAVNPSSKINYEEVIPFQWLGTGPIKPVIAGNNEKWKAYFLRLTTQFAYSVFINDKPGPLNSEYLVNPVNIINRTVGDLASDFGCGGYTAALSMMEFHAKPQTDAAIGEYAETESTLRKINAIVWPTFIVGDLGEIVFRSLLLKAHIGVLTQTGVRAAEAVAAVGIAAASLVLIPMIPAIIFDSTTQATATFWHGAAILYAAIRIAMGLELLAVDIASNAVYADHLRQLASDKIPVPQIDSVYEQFLQNGLLMNGTSISSVNNGSF